MDDDRDFAEESYWRSFCAECDGKCVSTTGHAELFHEHDWYDFATLYNEDALRLMVSVRCSECGERSWRERS